MNNSIYPENWDEIAPPSKEKRNQYWIMLKKARIDYCASLNISEYIRFENDFYDHVQSTYGIKVLVVEGNNISGDYTIVDEKKYLLFLMKYGT